MRSSTSSMRVSPGSAVGSKIVSISSSPEHVIFTEDRFRRRIFALLFVLMSLDVISFAAILPLFPSILNHFDTYDREVMDLALLPMHAPSKSYEFLAHG